MPLPRGQFRLSTLLWLTLAVACFFGGMRAERWMADRKARDRILRQNRETLDKFDGPNLIEAPSPFDP